MGGRRRLEVRSEAGAVLMGSNHRDGARNDGANGDGAQLTLRDVTIRAIALLAERAGQGQKPPSAVRQLA